MSAALPGTDPAADPAVLLAAACWRRYWEPDACAWRAQAAEREVRRRLRALSGALAGGMDWRAYAGAHTSYADLEHRRATPVAVFAVCGAPGCGRRYRRPPYHGGPVAWVARCTTCATPSGRAPGTDQGAGVAW